MTLGDVYFLFKHPLFGWLLFFSANQRLGEILKPNPDPEWLGKNHKEVLAAVIYLLVPERILYLIQPHLLTRAFYAKRKIYKPHCFKRSGITKNTKSPKEHCKCSELHCTHSKHFEALVFTHGLSNPRLLIISIAKQLCVSRSIPQQTPVRLQGSALGVIILAILTSTSTSVTM